MNENFFIVDVGKIGMFETPTSTTFNPEGNKEFGDFHITILAPKGTNGGYIEKLMESETKGMEILKVKITNENDISKLEKDAVVSVPVSISSVNGNLYYSQISQIKFLNKEIVK